MLIAVFIRHSNFDFSINKYEDARDQFDSLTDRLTLSVTDQPLINCSFLPRHFFCCRGSFVQSVMGYFYMADKSIFITELNNGSITKQVYFNNDFE